MNEISNAIQNLEVMSQTLERLSNDPKHFNSYYANHLEQLSWELFKTAKELVQINYAFGGA